MRQPDEDNPCYGDEDDFDRDDYREGFQPFDPDIPRQDAQEDEQEQRKKRRRRKRRQAA
jgi:hypothetical protein